MATIAFTPIAQENWTRSVSWLSHIFICIRNTALLDGANRIGPLLDRVKELGMDACAITDHGAMYGVVDFTPRRKRGIHPVIGCEIYVCENMDDRSANGMRAMNHLIPCCAKRRRAIKT